MNSKEGKQDLSQVTANQIPGLIRRISSKLASFESTLEGLTFLEWLRQRLEDDKTPRIKVENEIGLSTDIITKLASRYGISYLTHREAVRLGLENKWKDADFRQRHVDICKARWDDPEFRQRNIAGIRARWENPESRQRGAAISRATLSGLRQDPNFIRKSAEATQLTWQDQDFRQRINEGKRRARLNPQNWGRYTLPTISGERWDIGYAQSAWEANLARILRFVGRDLLVREPLRLDDNSVFELDFLTLDGRDRMVGYEIMAHPKEDPNGWEKLEAAITQYPNITFKIVNTPFYRRLERRFSSRINEDNRFAGWEDGEDNLRVNPGRFGPIMLNQH